MSDHATLGFTVYGRPAPAGSKRAFQNRHTGRVQVVDANRKAAPWKQEVAGAALKAAAGRVFAKGTPLLLDATFVVARPASHHGTGRNAGTVKASAPARPCGAPDTTKLLRGLEDAITAAGVWHDDAQVVVQTAQKMYGWPERCVVTIRALLPTVAAMRDAHDFALPDDEAVA